MKRCIKNKHCRHKEILAPKPHNTELRHSSEYLHNDAHPVGHITDYVKKIGF